MLIFIDIPMVLIINRGLSNISIFNTIVKFIGIPNMVTILKTLYPNKIGISVVRGIRGRDLSTPYLSLIHISEPTRRMKISFAVFCL